MYEIHSKNADSDKEFLAFKKDTEEGIIKLCLSVNMVAEGIHGDIDGVIMLRETMSPNLYFQMIGRAFSCGKKTIPLIFDLVANSQFISDAVDNFPNELKGEIEKRKEEYKKEGKEYEVDFDVDEFIVMDYFMDVVSGFKEIEGRLKGREWTEEENEILKKWYPVEVIKVVDKLRGRTKLAVKNQVRKLGLKAPDISWTEEEDAILRRYYSIEGLNVVERLEGRTEVAIKSQARKLGLKAPDDISWTEEENKILKEYYPIEGIKVKDRLNGRTELSVKSKANKLGIKYKNNNRYKYVYKNRNKYIVRFRVDGKKRCFGTFDNEEEAARVALEKAKELGKAV